MKKLSSKWRWFRCLNCNLKIWIKSFNIDNLQVIEYKTLIPIYCFIQGLESKLSICLKPYGEIVLQEINSLMEKDFKTTEENLYNGSSINTNINYIFNLQN